MGTCMYIHMQERLCEGFVEAVIIMVAATMYLEVVFNLGNSSKIQIFDFLANIVLTNKEFQTTLKWLIKHIDQSLVSVGTHLRPDLCSWPVEILEYVGMYNMYV